MGEWESACVGVWEECEGVSGGREWSVCVCGAL